MGGNKLVENPFYIEAIEASHSGIIALDSRGFIVIFNKAAKKIVGREDQELVGKHFKEVNSKQWAELKTLLETGTCQIGRKIDLGKMTLLANRTPIGTNNSLVGLISIFQDITELESQLKKTRELAEEYHSKLEKIRIQDSKLDGFVAVSKKMRKLVKLALRVALVNVPVLLQGETGVGKEVIAKLIHSESDKSKGMFMKIDCATIPENLLESELFGYEKGAFTGASETGKRGLFELAEGGTLFLDEIEALPMNLQVKLLNAVQELEIIRVGGVKPIKINTRIIASSNRDLYQMVESKTFREDLFFRLNVAPVFIPPLRERKEDIIPLVNHFLQKYNTKHEKHKSFSRSVINSLIEHKWTGNVRELENLIEYLVVTSDSEPVGIEDLITHKSFSERISLSVGGFSTFSSLRDAVSRLEYNLINEAIDKCGSVRKAAKFLKVNPSTLTRKKKRYKTLNA